MRVVLAVLSIASGLAASAHAFSLDNVKAIRCTDADRTANANLYFTTDDGPAKQFMRWLGTIPYDYGNTQTPGHSRSGQFTVVNNPDNPAGWVQLNDYYQSEKSSSLVLAPTQNSSVYNGYLSGEVLVGQSWVQIHSHPMVCDITEF